MASDVNVFADIGNFVIPRHDPFPRVPTYDNTPHVVQRLMELWASNGVERSNGIGLYRDVEFEMEPDLGQFGAAIEASASHDVLVYQTSVAPADITGAAPRTGVVFSGAASIGGEVSGADGRSSHVGGEVAFAVDVHHVEGSGNFLQLTIEGDATTGTGIEIIDVQAARLAATAEASTSITVQLSAPLNSDTTSTVTQIGVELAAGQVPTDSLIELYDLSDVVVTVSSGQSTEGAAGVDVGVVEIDAGTSQTTSGTQTHLQKSPGGELYSAIDLQASIDAAVAAHNGN